MSGLQTGFDSSGAGSNGSFFSRNNLTTALFSIFNFKDAIQQTLNTDLVLKDMRKTSYIVGKDNQDNIFSNVLYNQFLRSYISTRLMYDRLEVIRNQYLVKIITQTLMEDAFSEDPVTGNIFTVSVKEEFTKSKVAKSLIKEIDDVLNLDSIISPSSGIMEDAIFYGEYALELKLKGTGKKGFENIAIVDANPPGTLFGIYDNTEPQYFVRVKKRLNNSGADALEAVPASTIWHLTIFPRKLRFNMYEGLSYVGNSFDGNMAYPDAGTTDTNYRNNFDINEIAHYFRIGESPFLRVYDKIIELEMFEKSQVARAIGDARRSTLAGVTAPDGLELDQLDVFRKYYENILNENGTFTTQGIADLGQIGNMVLNLANIRVIPQQSQRGQLEIINTSSNSTQTDSTKDAIIDRREVICEGAGFPFEYIFGTRNGNVDLRRYARYCRTVKRVQGGTSESIKRLYAQLLNHADPTLNIRHNDILVSFYNTINITELDKLEFNDALTGLLQNFTRYFQDMGETEGYGEYIDRKALMTFVKNTLNSMEGASDIINLKGTEEVIKEPEEGTEEIHEKGFHEEKYFEDDITENYPIQPIRKYIKGLLTSTDSASQQNWINFASRRYPDVPDVVLIDVKNDLQRELSKSK